MTASRHAQDAASALHNARQAWPWVAAVVDTGPGRAPVPHRLGPAGLAGAGERIRAERADQATLARSGLYPAGASPAPAHLGALDARGVALDAATQAAWIARSALRGRRLWFGGPDGARGPGGRCWAAGAAHRGRLWAAAAGYPQFLSL